MVNSPNAKIDEFEKNQFIVFPAKAGIQSFQ